MTVEQLGKMSSRKMEDVDINTLVEVNSVRYDESLSTEKKVEKMIDVAYSIMDGAVAPDIFNQIPLKKDGTFQADRTIPVFSNGIGYVDTYIGANSNSYIDACGVQLCIFAEQSEFGHEPADYDQMEFCSKTRAKLVIRERNGLVKKYLLNADMSVNDIVSRAKNLKDTDVKPGSVYLLEHRKPHPTK